VSRIAIFAPSLSGGGAERVVLTLVNAWTVRGFVVDLVLASATGPYLKDVSRAVRVIDLKKRRLREAILPLAAYLRRVRPQAMLSVMTHANIVALLARKLARVPTRIVVSERVMLSESHARHPSLAAFLLRILVRQLYSSADAICTVARAASEDLARLAGLPVGRVHTIYNPFDLNKIEALARDPVPHPWLEAGQPPVILALGRLTEQKDFSTLIRAFAVLRETRQVRLLILGEGELREILESQLRELGLSLGDVQLPGYMRNPFAWLSRCALFVLSSRYEGLPGALIEAMACGASVVSTECPSGPEEILEGGRWGTLVPVGEVQAMAHAMNSALDTPKHQSPDVRLRAADFELERAVDAYLRLLGLPDRADEWLRRGEDTPS
jgi:glycosyltransferase involved in cell wall biosynthesis